MNETEVKKEGTAEDVLKNQIKELEAQLKNTKTDAEISIALAMSHPRNLKAAKVMLETGGIFSEEGVDGEALQKNIKKLKEDHSWLFENEKETKKNFSSGMTFGYEENKNNSELSDEEYYKKIIK